MSYPLSRFLSTATAGYGVFALTVPEHLGKALEADKEDMPGLDLLAQSYGVRDLAISSLGIFGRSGRTVKAAMLLRIAMDLGDAVRDAGNRWVFNDQLVDGLEPWGGVQAVWAFGSPQAGHGVDTTDTFDAGVASLEAHGAYIEGLGWEHFDPAEFLEGVARASGTRMGVPFAVGFEVFSLGWGS
jgi:hypothetical protein